MLHTKEGRKVIYTTICNKITCDICGKVIADANHEDYFYEVVTGHHDWGNDSVDSVKQFDICSDECLAKVFKDYIEDNNSVTKYIEARVTYPRLDEVEE